MAIVHELAHLVIEPSFGDLTDDTIREPKLRVLSPGAGWSVYAGERNWGSGKPTMTRPEPTALRFRTAVR